MVEASVKALIKAGGMDSCKAFRAGGPLMSCLVEPTFRNEKWQEMCVA